MTTTCNTLTNRAYHLRPTTYQLIGGLALAFFSTVLLAPEFGSGDGGAIKAATNALRGASAIELLFAIAALGIVLTMAVVFLTNSISAFIGLVLFVVAWSPETLTSRRQRKWCANISDRSRVAQCHQDWPT